MNRLLISFSLILFSFLFSSVAAQTEAFPGAEGFGMYTTGGRGGTVYHVTRLDDSGGAGTFRYACEKEETRTIVFDISGTIHLRRALSIKGNVTIAGQTAPGDGICVADYPVEIKGDNVIVRYMRFRLGNKYVANHEGDGLGAMDHNNIIIDHCSVSWSIDECLSVYGGKNITVQWCIASQSLRNSGHSKGAHGYGGNWGGAGASYHHNLLVHHDSRTPRLGPRPGTQTNDQTDLRNNVIYNWCGNGCYGAEGMHVNIVNNYYKPGPGTAKRNETIQQRIAKIDIRTSSYTKHNTASPNEWDVMWHVWGKYYVNGNVNTKYTNVARDNWTYGIYNQISNGSDNDYTYTESTKDTIRLRTPVVFQSVTTHSAEQAYEQVLAYAGASLHRDWVDDLMVSDTRNGKATYTGKADGDNPGIIDSQDDNRPTDASDDWQAWPVLANAAPLTDTDQDGMPDEWENAHGLNPNDKTDGAKDSGNGYTNLEVYMNSIVEHITTQQNEGGIMLNGQQEYTSGIPSVMLPTVDDDHAYTLSGQHVKSPSHKGIYIIHHRKVVVK